jgi:hypothetical protein
VVVTNQPPTSAVVALRSAIDKATLIDDNPAYVLGKVLDALNRGKWQIVADDELDTLRATKAAAYAFAEEMGDYCSPHGVAADYAQRLRDRLDQTGGAR